MSEDGWTWELARKARVHLEGLDPHEQDRILNKLDEVVESQWRDPPEYGEPLQNSPRRQVRVGEYRLAVTFIRDERRMIVARIKRRGGRTLPTTIEVQLEVATSRPVPRRDRRGRNEFV